MPFDINNNNEFVEDSEGSIKIDGMLSDEEKRELQEAFECDCGEVRDETHGKLAEFLHGDVIPHLENSELSPEIQEKVIQLSEAYPYNPIDLGITIPQDLEDTLSQEGLNFSLDTVLADVNSLTTSQLQKPEDSQLSNAEYSQFLDSIGYLVEGEIGELSGVIEELIQDNEDLSLSELRWIINEKISSFIKDSLSRIIRPAKFFLYHTSQTGISNTEQQINENPGLSDSRKQSLIDRYHHRIQQFKRSILTQEPSMSIYNMIISADQIKDYVDFQSQHEQNLQEITEGFETSLLSEEDKKIERDAMQCFMGAIALHIAIEGGPALLASVVPGFGTAAGAIIGNFVGAGIDIADIFSSKETLLEIVKGLGFVPQEYHMEKTLIDNILAGIGLIPGLTLAIKSTKLANLMRKFRVSGDEVLKSMEKILPILSGERGHTAYRVENGERVSTGVASDEVLKANGLLSESERYSAAEELLGISLSPTQQKLLMQAHNVPPQAHNVSPRNNVRKGMILMREGGFTRNQAQILMDQGIAGIFDILKSNEIKYNKLLNSLDASQLQLGDKLQVQTKSESLYEFQVTQINQDGVPILQWTGGGVRLQGLDGVFGGDTGNIFLKTGDKLHIGRGSTSPVKTMRVVPGKIEKTELLKSFKSGEEVYVKRLNGTVERGWKIIQKNEDGTYKVQKGQMGKNSVPEEKLFSIQQIEGGNTKISENAAEFERRKLQLLEGNMNLSQAHFNRLFNGDFGQQNTGNCYLVAALHSLKESPDFELIMRSSIKILSNGAVEVTIPLLSQGKGQKILISQSDTLPQDIGGKIYQPIDGPIGFQILEAAYIKGKFGSLDRAKSEGGFGHEALGRMVGNNFDKTVIGTFGSGKSLGEQGKQDIFNSFAENYDPKRFIATANSIYNKGGHDSSYTIDGITIHHSHAYSILNIDKFGKTITLRNPWTRNEPFVMTYDQFLRAFSGVDGVQINYNNLLSNT